MTDKPLKPSQKAFLMLLMAEAREVSNSELLERYGVSIVGEDHRVLMDQKLVTSRKVGRANAHELTDRGWARCREELSAEYVKGTGPAFPALHALATAVHRYLERADLSPADVFTASTAPPPPVERPKAASAAKIDVARRIRNAYKKLCSEPKAWVSLTDLRPALVGIPTADVDAALTKMALARKILLMPEENQKTLTQQDRDAAIHIGGEDKHLLSIEAA